MTHIGTFLYGSQNYGLDLPTSDKDYKHIVVPTFDDLYDARQLNRQRNEHESDLDIRDFAKGLVKGNPNYIELLYSTEAIYGPELGEVLDFAREMYYNKYVINVLPYFLKATKGAIMDNFTTWKNYVRSRYFCQLLFKLKSNDWRMSSKVWRDENDSFIDYLKELRQNEGAISDMNINFIMQLIDATVDTLASARPEVNYDFSKEIDHLYLLTKDIILDRL